MAGRKLQLSTDSDKRPYGIGEPWCEGSCTSGGKQHVPVNVILDKSGSMSTKVQDVIGGFNLYLDELAKEQAVDYGFSLTLFGPGRNRIRVKSANKGLSRAKLAIEPFLSLW